MDWEVEDVDGLVAEQHGRKWREASSKYYFGNGVATFKYSFVSDVPIDGLPSSRRWSGMSSEKSYFPTYFCSFAATSKRSTASSGHYELAFSVRAEDVHITLRVETV